MPNSPQIDGLPVWLQVAVTVLFGILSFAVFMRSYQAPQTHQQTTFAHLTDMQPVRDLSVQIAALVGQIAALIQREQETEHYTRNQIEEMVRLRHAIEGLNRTLGQ